MAGNAKLTPSTRLAVLGLLLERPSWGYELDARFKRTFGAEPWEWRVTPQAIYNALKRLEDAGLIEPIGEEIGERSIDSKQRAMRQTYRVTGVRARSMREWLGTPMSSSSSHKELLIRLHIGDAMERDPLLSLIQRLAHESGIATLLTAGDTTSVTGADRVLRLSDGELLGRPPSPAADVVELRRLPASESSS